MKTPRLIVLLLIAVLVVAAWTAQGQKQNAAKVQWEYKIYALKMDEDLTEERLNQLGAEGWELIPMRTEGVNKIYYHFKRQK